MAVDDGGTVSPVVAEARSAAATASHEQPGELELVGVSRRFGATVALDDVSFRVPAGRLVGFVGPNGAGKTTAMRVVVGVTQPDAGAVLWGGRPVGTAVRQRFGYIPEERGLYPKMRVRDQLVYLARLHGLPPDAASRSVDGWLRRLELVDRAADRVERLSLGNQQRVQLAAALVHDPALLVLDEPFSGLDPVGVDALSDVLRERAARGVPVLFSSHQLDLVERLCESVVIVSRGRVVAAGRTDDLRASGNRRLRVHVAAAGDWMRDLSGVRVLGRDGSGVVLELADGADDQAVLDAAKAAGRVLHFSSVRPTLTELFRDVVT